jgi:sugar lactone lactonase YvrE
MTAIVQGFGRRHDDSCSDMDSSGHAGGTRLPAGIAWALRPPRIAPGGVWVISPEGKHLGTIRAPEQSTNIGFGDADRKTLYIAARTSIYKIRVNTPGT